MNTSFTRRHFIQAAAAVVAAARPATLMAAGDSVTGVPLGFDNFAVRAMKWKAADLIKYAAELKLDYLLISDLEAYDSHDDGYLKTVKEQANQAGVKLHAGTGSICPTSNSFNPKYGSAEDHARLLIRVAKGIGSNVARCYLGNSGDRNGDGGIERHIEEMVKICKAVRGYSQDMGVKLAVENHAGDMQAWELVQLVEAAGRDQVGVTLDAGNAAWTLEDPAASFETLAPYALTCSIRDSMLWEDEKGIQVQWVIMGQGLIDWKSYAAAFAQKCAGMPFILETICGGPRGFATLDPNFWKPYRNARAYEYAKFVALAKKGKPYQQPTDRPMSATNPEELNQLQQKYDLETSLKYCREALGLGLKS